MLVLFGTRGIVPPLTPPAVTHLLNWSAFYVNRMRSEYAMWRSVAVRRETAAEVTSTVISHFLNMDWNRISQLSADCTFIVPHQKVWLFRINKHAKKLTVTSNAVFTWTDCYVRVTCGNFLLALFRNNSQVSRRLWTVAPLCLVGCHGFNDLCTSKSAMSKPRPSLGFLCCISSLHTDERSLFW